MKIKKKIFAIVLCLSMTISLVTNVFANNDHIDSEFFDGFTSSVSSEFVIPGLTTAELENICAYVNGDLYIHNELIEEIQHCGTEATLWINYYYDNHLKQKSIPAYLSEAYKTVNSKADVEIRSYYNTTSYVDSESGRFRVFYNEAPQSTDIVGIANFVAIIFDAVDYYLCDYYGFNRPTTNGSQYHISIINSTSGGAGNTPYLSNNRSRINLAYDYIQGFYYNADDAYLLGMAIHEYMHAILFSYGIMTGSPEDIWFHESLAQASAIEYEITFANASNVCDHISTFISSLQYSMGSLDTVSIKYGGAVFHLFLFEDYDEWFTIAEALENRNPSLSMLSNINNFLVSEYNSSLASAYIHFLYYCTNPDVNFESSPTNRMFSGARTWGRPMCVANYNVGSTNTSFTGAGVLPCLAAHYIKLTPNTYLNKTVTITVNYSSISGNAIPSGAYSLHQTSNGTYLYSGNAVINNVYTDWCTVNMLNNGELYFIIANAGTTGNFDYSYTITISN